MSDITLITPTGDRPEAIRRCAYWMSRQTYSKYVQWIIVDDGEHDELDIDIPGWRIEHIRRKDDSSPSVQSFAGNLLAALPLVQNEKVLIIEDDDYYDPLHVEFLSFRLNQVYAMGDARQHYYHVPSQQWLEMNNMGSSLAQTGFHRSLIPKFEKSINRGRDEDSRGIDRFFWDDIMKHFPASTIDIYNNPTTVIGLKGMSGRPGLGIGHRPSRRRKWQQDRGYNKLIEWMGEEDAKKVIPQ